MLPCPAHSTISQLQICVLLWRPHSIMPPENCRIKQNKRPRLLIPVVPVILQLTSLPFHTFWVLFCFDFSYFLPPPVLSLHRPTLPLGTASGLDPTPVSHLLPLPIASTHYFFLICPLKCQNLPNGPSSLHFLG